eukprot:jgi/Psemu1/25483/gm1.25483_g
MSSNIESNKADPESNEEIIVAEAHFENNLDARTVAPVGTNERGNDVEATSAVMVEPMAEQVVSRQPEPCCCDVSETTATVHPSILIHPSIHPSIYASIQLIGSWVRR